MQALAQTKLPASEIFKSQMTKLQPPPCPAELPDIEMLDEPRAFADQQPPLPKSTAKDSAIEQALTESQIRGEGARPNMGDVQDVDEDRRPKRTYHKDEDGVDAEVEVKMRQWLSSRKPQTYLRHIWRM